MLGEPMGRSLLPPPTAVIAIERRTSVVCRDSQHANWNTPMVAIESYTVADPMECHHVSRLVFFSILRSIVLNSCATQPSSSHNYKPETGGTSAGPRTCASGLKPPEAISLQPGYVKKAVVVLDASGKGLAELQEKDFKMEKGGKEESIVFLQD